MLATEAVAVAASSNWSKYSFTLTASKATTCEGIPPGSNPEARAGTLPCLRAPLLPCCPAALLPCSPAALT